MSAATAKPPETKTPEPSMDEILASIRRIIADDQEPAGAARTDAAATSGEAPPSAPDDAAEVPEFAFADLSTAEIVPPKPVEAPPPPVVEAPPVARTASPEVVGLISSEATESVAHAFNALSSTILSQNARTLEDLVKDLLKPMLKSWLDDNLPPLVERLVRTEIERVARGNR